MCDCRDHSSCRHPLDPAIVDNPALLALWCAWRDAVEVAGTRTSPDAVRAYRRLDDAYELATAPAAGIH